MNSKLKRDVEELRKIVTENEEELKDLKSLKAKVFELEKRLHEVKYPYGRIEKIPTIIFPQGFVTKYVYVSHDMERAELITTEDGLVSHILQKNKTNTRVELNFETYSKAFIVSGNNVIEDETATKQD